mmetsp:Transcript_24873/g.59084  ORF Transcript_24873/g.59084 Transcript_24873/m.59084 type:complete len:185 (+) Transcript_24873:171-725(+)
MGAGASGGLSEEEIDELVTKTHFSKKQIKKLRKRFLLLDNRKLGVISLDEFSSLPELATNPLADRIVQTLSDKPVWAGGKQEGVDFVKFVLAMNAFAPQVPIAEKQKVLFKVYDVDGDGAVGYQDLFATFNRLLGQSVTRTHLEAVAVGALSAVDKDKDGLLNFHEFCSLMDEDDVKARMTLAV